MEGLYIYKMRSPDGEYAYAGMSSNVDNRVASHVAGKGCSWTREHNITTVVESYPALNRSDENVATLQLMAEYGIDHVRGGYFVMPDFDYSMTKRSIIVGLLRSMHDLCVNCGEQGHYANQCCNKHNDDYTLNEELVCNNGERDNWFDAISYIVTPLIDSFDDNHGDEVFDRFTTPRKVIIAMLRHASYG